MTISELIKYLEKERESRGDIELTFSGAYRNFTYWQERDYVKIDSGNLLIGCDENGVSDK